LCGKAGSAFTYSVAGFVAVGDVDGGVQVATVLSKPVFERLAFSGGVHRACDTSSQSLHDVDGKEACKVRGSMNSTPSCQVMRSRDETTSLSDDDFRSTSIRSRQISDTPIETNSYNK